MTTPPPPGSTPDEPTPDQTPTPAEAAPQVDSFAAEPPPEVPSAAAPEDAAPEAAAPEAAAPEAATPEAAAPPAPEVQPDPVEPAAAPTLADEQPAAPAADAPDAPEPGAGAPPPPATEPPAVQPAAPEPVTAVPVSPQPADPSPVAVQPVTPEPVSAPAAGPVPVVPPVPTSVAAEGESADEGAPTVTALDDPDRPASDEDEPPAAQEQAPAGRARPSWLPVAAVAATVAVLAGVTGFLTWELAQREDDRSARAERLAQSETAGQEAREAARDAAPLLFSYNHSRLEQDFQKGLAVTTGEFREEYSRTTKEVVTPVAEQYDAVVEAEVIETAVISAEPDEADVLVFLNQGTTSTRVQGQQVDQSRVRMHLVEVDGKWLVEAVEAL